MSTESVLRLSDKTVVIAAPFSVLTCSLMTTLTAYGADCALITSGAAEAQRFCENLSDAREVNENHGRAAAIAADLSNPVQALDAISRSAEVFGGVDIYIDAQMNLVSESFQNFDVNKEGKSLLEKTLFATMVASQAVLKFLEGRARSRLLYLVPDQELSTLPGEALNALLRTGFIQFTQALNCELAEKSVQVNCLPVGLTEEFLMKRFPKSPSIKLALAEMQKLRPGIKLQDPVDLANAVAFLVSPLSSAFSGKTIS